jgi:DNA processing protein
MINFIEFHIPELESMKKYPQHISYIGNLELLKKNKVAIVGSRKPNQYARQQAHNIASQLSQAGICIVSGGAIGTDIIAHKAAGEDNTIMVAGTGLDKRYPAINKNIIQEIEKRGLVLSQFREGTPSTRYNFPLRNEFLVALSDIVIVIYADDNSGTMRSIEYALKMNKKVYTIPHRIGESNATNKLLKKGDADILLDAQEIIDKFYPSINSKKDLTPFMKFCQTNPTYNDALLKFPTEVFEAELNGDIKVEDGYIHIIL